MVPDKESLRNLYRRRAGRYDFTANLYYLIGFRVYHYRRRAVEALGLNRGDTVVEVGCGTGLNFPLLQERVGPQGHIVGVDLTDAMLTRARESANRHGWGNVDLVQSDAAEFSFPGGTKGVLSTFALTLVPEYDEVIRAAAQALAAGGRLVVLDLKRPEGWPEWVVRFGVWISRPFGVALEMAERHPWESMARYLANVEVQELFGGFAYVCVGEARARQKP